jgi:hypothetical protein
MQELIRAAADLKLARLLILAKTLKLIRHHPKILTIASAAEVQDRNNQRHLYPK